MFLTLALSLGSFAAAHAQASSANDAKIQAEVTKALGGKQYSGVQASVKDGVVDLTGSVKFFANKEDADKRVHRIKDVAAVRNDIEVGNGETTISDQELQNYTPGVKDVVDEITVDPVSPMDDRIRRAVYRAVYGFPSLNRYAIDPAQPIRISVQNGNVTLFGVVSNQGDKNIAGIQANGVPGVFSVKNELQVAGQTSDGQ